MLPSPAGEVFDADEGGTEVEEFFRRPPPTYGGGDPMPPSEMAVGPTPRTEQYGPDRETRETSE
jgi:hypothetical protein